VQSDNDTQSDLYLQHTAPRARRSARVLAVGEVLWDQFPNSARLGGAPLNFAVHLQRLHHTPRLISGVGTDARGEEAKQAIRDLRVDATLLQSTSRFTTGSALVEIGPSGHVSFTIERPAAYDAVELPEPMVRDLVEWNPAWLYYGTLFPSHPHSRHVLRSLLTALPQATRFYDLNVRAGFDCQDLVADLLRSANVVKLNDAELQFVHERLGLPAEPEAFCRAGTDRYGWRAACVTLGARGCAMLVGDEYVRADGVRVDVADTVGAGDAFAAAFLHGLIANWPVARIADFANRVGAYVASVHGAIPDDIPEAVFST
jgi:fructokinase